MLALTANGELLERARQPLAARRSARRLPLRGPGRTASAGWRSRSTTTSTGAAGRRDRGARVGDGRGVGGLRRTSRRGWTRSSAGSTAWTRTRSAADVASTLQAAGVDAGAVADLGDRTTIRSSRIAATSAASPTRSSATTLPRRTRSARPTLEPSIRSGAPCLGADTDARAARASADTRRRDRAAPRRGRSRVVDTLRATDYCSAPNLEGHLWKTQRSAVRKPAVILGELARSIDRRLAVEVRETPGAGTPDREAHAWAPPDARPRSGSTPSSRRATTRSPARSSACG